MIGPKKTSLIVQLVALFSVLAFRLQRKVNSYAVAVTF
jgi:hypothetical protein